MVTHLITLGLLLATRTEGRACLGLSSFEDGTRNAGTAGAVAERRGSAALVAGGSASVCVSRHGDG
jgi:hypothetical protein